jgi:hypothetical protein
MTQALPGQARDGSRKLASIGQTLNAGGDSHFRGELLIALMAASLLRRLGGLFGGDQMGLKVCIDVLLSE